MDIFKILKFIIKSKNPHFLSVDKEVWKKWSFLIKLTILLNRKYKPCVIYRKKYKNIENFVVIGLRWNGKTIRRRTSGIAKNFVINNEDPICIYCEKKLTLENATSDHIIPISKGGNNTKVNMITCCKSCNNERGNISFEKYARLKNPKLKKLKYIFI